MKTTRNDSRSDVTTIGIPRAETRIAVATIGIPRAETPFVVATIGIPRAETPFDATEIGRRPIAEARNSYNFEKNFSIILSEATKRRRKDEDEIMGRPPGLKINKKLNQKIKRKYSCRKLL